MSEIKQELVSGKATLSIGGEPLEIAFTVPTMPVKLRRMLPVFQGMSDNFNGLAVAAAETQGKAISCKAGCGACCRQMVPVSEAEAFDLRDVVGQMPETRRLEIERRFTEGMKTLSDAGFFSRLAKAAASEDRTDYSRAIAEYFSFFIACPFLENESCSIHEHRPVACREYFVTSPAEHCRTGDGDQIENVHFLFRVKDSLISVARRNRPPELPFVPMIQVLEWTENRTDASPERSGGDWMRTFLGELVEIGRIANPELFQK